MIVNMNMTNLYQCLTLMSVFEENTEYIVKQHMKVHIQSKTSVEGNVRFDKCEHVESSSNALALHTRKTEHSYDVYHCGLCKFKASNINVVRAHKQTKHNGQPSIVKKATLCPPPVCDPSSTTNRSDCCEER